MSTTQNPTLFFSAKTERIGSFTKVLSAKKKKVFQAYTDGHLRVLNSLFPHVVARFVQLQPLSWHGRASAQVQLLGCPVAKVTPRSRSPGESPSIKVNMGAPRPSPSPTPTGGPVLVETRPSTSQPVIVAVGVVLGLIMCGCCLLAGVWWKRRKKESQMKYSLPKSCQSFQAKTLPCPQSQLISYPLERNVHDALPSPPLNDYAEPTVTAIGQKLGSTFRPSTDEGYTTPFILNHYDTPGNQPEYAEPLPPEPEYATPFSEQPFESKLTTLMGILHGSTHGPPVPAPGARTTSSHARYDCPSHRVLSNGYCTPALHGSGPRPVSLVYAEPKSCDSLLQNHTYEEPLWAQQAWVQRTKRLFLNKNVHWDQRRTWDWSLECPELHTVVQTVLMLTELNFQWTLDHYANVIVHFSDYRIIWETVSTVILPETMWLYIENISGCTNEKIQVQSCLRETVLLTCDHKVHFQKIHTGMYASVYLTG